MLNPISVWDAGFNLGQHNKIAFCIVIEVYRAIITVSHASIPPTKLYFVKNRFDNGHSDIMFWTIETLNVSVNALHGVNEAR